VTGALNLCRFQDEPPEQEHRSPYCRHHEDHVLTAQMIQAETDLKTTGAKIADIKDRHFTSMADYIHSYSHVAPLLDDYDHKLHEYADLCNRAQLRD
jgi:hypothetical protein